MTEGQQLALNQLKDVEAASEGSVEILDARLGDSDGRLRLEVSLNCQFIDKLEEGLPIRDRERFFIYIPEDFPFSRPKIESRHRRFSGYPHVQWGSYLCLYLAPDSEWDASDGMFGFLDRVELWLQKAALGELDPADAPLHPPVAYQSGDRLVVPRQNTPEVGDGPWYGFARLDVVSDERADIVGWDSSIKETDPPVASAILLDQPIDFFEFPNTVKGLLFILKKHGVPLRATLVSLQGALIENDEDAPLLLVIGTPMRGIVGEEEKEQHLVVWEVDPAVIPDLRRSLARYLDDDELEDIGEEAERAFWEWAEDADTTWCRVREARSEVTLRRDQKTPVSWFSERNVTLWGCGALGGYIAHYLARAGVSGLDLWDKGDVAPGLLVRQPFDDTDIGRNKACALKDQLTEIRPDLDVEAHPKDVLSNGMEDTGSLWGSDVIIDATAVGGVAKKFERILGSSELKIPVASVVIGPGADKGFMTLSKSGFSGGPGEVSREVKLESKYTDDTALTHYINEFWPDRDAGQEGRLQPEPGCSDVTFVGSAADVGSLSAMALNRIGAELLNSGDPEGTAHFFSLPQGVSNDEEKRRTYKYDPRHCYTDRIDDYSVRLSEEAWTQLTRIIKGHNERNDPTVETGGVLYGERDDASRVIWVDEVAGPPVDSEASREGFICGTVGVEERDKELRSQTDETVTFVGMWHTHPDDPPEPSVTDYGSMRRVLGGRISHSRKFLMLIIGNTASGDSVPGAYVFSRQRLEGAPPASLPEGRLITPFRYRAHQLFRHGRRTMRGMADLWTKISAPVRSIFKDADAEYD